MIAIAGSTPQQSADVIVYQKHSSVIQNRGSEWAPPASCSDHLRDFDSHVSPSNDDSIFIRFCIWRVSPGIFFQNSIILALMLFGLYRLAQECMPHLVSIFLHCGILDLCDHIGAIRKKSYNEHTGSY